MNETETSNLTLLTRVIAALEFPDETFEFLRELCTPHEVKVMAQRLGIAELLMQGIPQKEITTMLCDGAAAHRPSSATICRVSEIVKHGEGHLCRMIARAQGIEGC